jgi:hypothetical protein
MGVVSHADCGERGWVSLLLCDSEHYLTSLGVF